MAEDSRYGFFDVTKVGSLVQMPNKKTLQTSTITNGAIDMDQVAWSRGANPLDPEVAYVTPNLYYVDGSDALGNQGLTIQFQYLSTGEYTTFKAFITAFNETYNSDWSEEQVFGRADPLLTFKQTSRTMTLSFAIPAASQAEGFENMGRLQKLLSFLYPAYTDVDNALSITQSPLVRMKVMNLTSLGSGTYQDHLQGRSSMSLGLLGAITNVNVNHNIDNPEHGVFVTAEGTIIPKLLEVTLDFKVIHENHLGWKLTGGNAGVYGEGAGGDFSDPAFPYGANLKDSKYRDASEQNEFIDQEAQGYTQAVLDERVEQAREAGLQAAMDTAKAKLLKKDGTLNARGRRWKRRLAETENLAQGRDGTLRSLAVKNPAKASHMMAAVAAAELASGEPTIAEPRDYVASQSGRAGQNAENVREQRWSFLR